MGTRQLLSTLPEDFHVTLLDKEIYPVSSAKDLGIILDKSLTYHDHVTEVVSDGRGCSLSNKSRETFA